VIAEDFAPRVTSVVAGALWEWPPAVCGHHHDLVSLGRSKAWAATSYEIFTDLARDPATGVFLRPATFYAKRPIAEDPRLHAKVEELKGRVRQFRHAPTLIAENGVTPALGLRDAYSHLAPMIDTDVYMSWLLDRVRAAGCTVLGRKVSDRCGIRSRRWRASTRPR
jgi:D-amino-acid oxidase